MKKTLLSMLVAAVAAPAIAGNIYSTETTQVSFSGEIDGYFATTDIQGVKTDADVNMWAKVQMDAEQKITDSLTGFTSFEIQAGSWYDGTDSNAQFDDVLIGLKSEFWGVAMGEVGDLANASNAIEKDDITNEGYYMGAAGGNHRESAGKGFVGKAVVGPMTFVADVNTVADSEIDNTYGISADFEHELFSIGTSYISGEVTETTDFELYGVSASTEFKGVYLAATYAEFEGVNSFGFYKTDETAKGNTLGLAASYSIDKTRIYTTYSVVDVEAMTGTDQGDVSNWVIGADFQVASNITAFAEYQQGEADWEAEDSMTVVTGIYYSF